jgi:hypothetical protein
MKDMNESIRLSIIGIHHYTAFAEIKKPSARGGWFGNNLFRGDLGQCPDAAGTDFQLLAGNPFGLQVDVLALDCLDVRVGTGSILGGAASACITTFCHIRIFLKKLFSR